MTLWNVASFFITYADIEKPSLGNISPENLSLMDRWILSLTQNLVKKVTRSLERYDCAPATLALETFIDLLSTWYVRRSRRRFWKSDLDQDKSAAYNTLYKALMTCVKLMAPIPPFSSEKIYQAIAFPEQDDRERPSKNPESVHLCDWPLVKEEWLEEEMSAVMEVAQMGLSMRNKSGIKVRQPLSKLFVFTQDAKIKAALEHFRDTLKDELNVKDIPFSEENMELPEGSGASGFEVMEGNGFPLALNTAISRDLKMEGLVRDFVRHVQEFRKESGLAVQDRTSLQVSCSGMVKEAATRFSDYIKSETPALEMDLREPDVTNQMEFKLGIERVVVGISRKV